jgi:uncharacterized protein (DUF2384 family)
MVRNDWIDQRDFAWTSSRYEQRRETTRSFAPDESTRLLKLKLSTTDANERV